MSAEYLIFNLLVFLPPFVLSLLPHAEMAGRWRPVATSIAWIALPFLVWDAWVAGEHWRFNEAYVLGPRIAGLPIEEIMSVARVACAEAWPDLVVVFDVDEKTATRRRNGVPRGKRAADKGPGLFEDRMELKKAEFHQRVRDGFRQQAKRDPETYALVDARKAEDEVFAATIEAVRSHFVASREAQG